MPPITSHIIVLMLAILPFVGAAQPADWKETTANNGKVRIKYTVDALKDKAGNERIVGQYSVKTTVNIKLHSAEKLLRNAAKYKDFLDNTEVSKSVGTTSKNEWLLYVYVDAPWPMPNADCVQRVTIARTDKELTVTCIAQPDAYPMQSEQRMDISDTKYHFIETAPGKVEVTITGKFSPMGPITKFLLETWFPNGPVTLMENLVKEINAH